MSETDVASAGTLLGATERQERKAPVGACRLPPELLITIFELVRKDWLPQRDKVQQDVPAQYASGWMSILHVCATWRRLALSLPMLWRDVDAVNVHPMYAPEILARSADLPLRLTFDLDRCDTRLRDTDKHVVKALRAWSNAHVFSRLESFDVGCRGQKRILDMLWVDAPSIKTLRIRGHGLITLPRYALGYGDPPKLCHLSLHNCRLPEDFSLLVPALTHLKLVRVDLVSNGRGRRLPLVKKPLSMLSALSGLEYLYIDAFPRAKDFTYEWETVKMSPFLKSMTVHLYHSSSFDVMEHLSVPTTANVCVDVLWWTGAPQTMYHRVLTGTFSADHAPDLHIELELRSQDRWCLYRLDPASGLRVGTRRADFRTKDDICRRDVLLNLPVRPRSLIVSSGYWREGAGDALADILLLERDLCRITIHYSDHAHLRSLLSDAHNSFLSLDTIVFTSTRYSWRHADESRLDFEDEFVDNERTACESGVDTGVLEALTSNLVGVVEARRRAGAPIREIRVEGELAGWNGWGDVRSIVDVVRL